MNSPPLLRLALRPTLRLATLGLVGLALGLVMALATPAHASDSADSLAAALAASDRSDAEKLRDVGRKPAEIIAFLGVEPGMTVLDLVAASGYYTEVLSEAVGEKGKVYAQNPPRLLQMREGAADKAMTSRLAGGRLANVERLDVDLAEVSLAPGSVDAAMTALNYHDIHNGSGAEAAAGFLEKIYSLLKPGAVLGIIDHHGNEGADNESLHRIHEGVVLAAVEASPFELDTSSDLLRNPEDDHSHNVFEDSIRGKTDRFVLRLRKPAKAD
jgi:predicted methyltransferase